MGRHGLGVERLHRVREVGPASQHPEAVHDHPRAVALGGVEHGHRGEGLGGSPARHRAASGLAGNLLEARDPVGQPVRELGAARRAVALGPRTVRVTRAQQAVERGGDHRGRELGYELGEHAAGVVVLQLAVEDLHQGRGGGWTPEPSLPVVVGQRHRAGRRTQDLHVAVEERLDALGRPQVQQRLGGHRPVVGHPVVVLGVEGVQPRERSVQQVGVAWTRHARSMRDPPRSRWSTDDGLARGYRSVTPHTMDRSSTTQRARLRGPRPSACRV